MSTTLKVLTYIAGLTIICQLGLVVEKLDALNKMTGAPQDND
jgi:hypothetical protein